MQDEEVRLTRFIESVVGGTVVALNRQARWRKSWFATVERNGETLPIYVRGDKSLDAEPFPGLRREADILQLLEANGIPAPHVYGYCEDPMAIVMDLASGDRDVSKAASDAERQAVAEQYIAVLATMHSLDPALFAAKGIAVPRTPEDIVLAYIHPNQRLYDRTKRSPEPMIEFALRWLRRNMPQGRNRAAFIHCDAGQFLFEEGRLTAVYDFEASHIGDPLADLAALRLRGGFEPIGADVSHLLRHYATLTGEAIDSYALSYHTAAFALTSVMALAGLLREPDKHTLQMEYLVWDLTTRRATLWAIAECMGITLQTSPSKDIDSSRDGLVIDVLQQVLARLDVQSDFDKFQLQSAQQLSEWLRSLESGASIAGQRDLVRAADILGHKPRNWQEADAELERFVMEAGPDDDAPLLRYFADQLEERIALALPVRHRLEGYALAPVVL